jgi:GNAT superfamily N-acetyltransferase
MTISIREVSSEKEKKVFIKVPWHIYRHDPHWVPPLIIDRIAFLSPKKNPFFKSAKVKFFVAYNDRGTAVGRIAAIVSANHLKIHNDGAGFFGLFESVDDQQVSDMLFNRAAEWLREQGMSTMRGPISMNINDEIGLLIDGFDSPPVLMLPYNPPYYEELLRAFGFKKEIDWYAYYIDVPDRKIPERLAKGAELAKKRYKFTIRKVNMKDYDNEVKRVQAIYNSAWEKNWGAVPFTDEEFKHLAKDLKLIVNPDLVFMAEVDGKVVGVSLALPDLNQALIKIKNGKLLPFGIVKLLRHRRKIDMIRLAIMGVLKEYRNMGIETCLIHETYANGLKTGAWRCEMSQILENNAPMNNILIKLGAKRYKTYRIYDYKL